MDFIVHTAAVQKVAVAAALPDGTPVSAEIDGLVVELVGGGHCHTWQFVPGPDMTLEQLVAKYPMGATITVTHTLKEAV